MKERRSLFDQVKQIIPRARMSQYLLQKENLLISSLQHPYLEFRRGTCIWLSLCQNPPQKMRTGAWTGDKNLSLYCSCLQTELCRLCPDNLIYPFFNHRSLSLGGPAVCSKFRWHQDIMDNKLNPILGPKIRLHNVLAGGFT